MRGGLATAGLLLAIGNSQAALRLDESGLTSSEAAATRTMLDAAWSRLPVRLRTDLHEDITVRWTASLDASVHGRAEQRALLLNRDLLPASTRRSDPQARERVMAAVLHEVAHFHDRAAHVSRDPRFLDLAGWQVRATRLVTRVAGRSQENRFVDRSPDPYELTKPSEFFAVNLEHYVLDPQYACRRPALQRYLEQQLGVVPGAAGSSCTDDLAYVDAGEGDGGALASIDPTRVYAIDYLLAEGNSQPMSRWGHSMLRLIVCAPGRAPGPDCRLDLAYHRVLSFRAFVDDVQISSWRGLTGRYPSRLFVLPLEQVVDEYTKVELRGLRSVPLRLERDEIAAVLERTAQLHWSYDGRYYFLGNNCAAETWKLLHDSVPRLADQGLGSITPTGLLRRLERAGIADASALDDEAQAVRQGYRFESQGAYFAQLYQTAQQSLGLPVASVERWMALPPEQRRPWLARADLRSSAALLLLEQAAQRRQEVRVREELKRRYLGSEAGTPDAVAARDAVQRLLQQSMYLGRPSQLLADGGYGVPQQEERAAIANRGEQLRAQLQRIRADLETHARQWLDTDERERIDGIAANRDLLGERLRVLHQEAGGLQLR